MSIKDTVSFDTTDKLVPVGKIKLELFNADTGEKEFEQEKNNFVKQSRLDQMSRLIHYNLFPTTEQRLTLSNYYDSVYLTTNSETVSPQTERFVGGNFTAYGVLGDTNGNKEKGTFNSVETSRLPARQKLVFDFPTSAGNGTFQSIYTTNSGSDRGFTMLTSMSRYSTHFSYTRAKIHQGRVYFIDSGGKKIHHKSDLSANSYVTNVYITNSSATDYTTIDYANSNYASIIVRDVTFKGEFMFLLAEDRYIYKATINDPLVLTRLVQLSATAIATGSYSTFTFLPMTNKFYFLGKSDGSEISIFDEAFSLLGKVPVANKWLNMQPVGMSHLPSQPNCLMMGGVLFNVETGDSTLCYYERQEISIIEANEEYLMGYKTSASSDIYLFPSANFFSRVLLDAPVTKTSTQTMKITYEFIIPPYGVTSFSY